MKSEQDTTSHKQSMEKTLKQLAAQFEHAMLVSQVPQGGEMNARPMALVEVTESGKLLFVTHLGTNKVDEVLRHPEVCVTMQNGTRSVSIGGVARVRQDQEKLEQIWRPSFDSWLDGPDKETSALIEVHPKVGEYWNLTPGSILRLIFDEAKSFFTNENVDWETRTHGRVNFQEAG